MKQRPDEAGAATDSALVAAVLEQGDEAAFRALYRRYTPRLYLMVLRMLGGRVHDAEDVIQDLVASDAEIQEVDWTAPLAVVRARAALRRVLGYPQWLAALTSGTAELRMWLSHYAPIPPDPGKAA